MSSKRFVLEIAIVVASLFAFYPNSAIAQINPDATLPNNTNVDENLVDKTFNITGGSASGGNLFHSFKEFSVPAGSTAFFNNGADIQNIINRVTGGSISNIDGLIKANGSANLFLMNPNGIVFGENARLDIGGSFLGTSAESMKFSDGSEFSAVNPQSEPLLTVNVPLGLQFGTNPGSIQVRGNGEGARDFDSPIIDTQDALRVEADKTLALIGGDINLEGATLKTAGGRIELGSVGENSLVNLTPTNKGFALNYGGVANFRDIKLSQQAIVDASGEGAGDIQVQGKLVRLTDSSWIETSTLGAKPGGDLIVNATESIEIIGSQSRLRASVFPGATGDGGDLSIQARQLLIKDGAQVNASTFGAGNGGNLNVTAPDSIQVIGRSADGNSASALSSQANSKATGDTGDLTIKTANLLVKDGAQVGVGTFSAGNAGNFTVIAQNSIEVIGDRKNPTGLFSQTGENVTGDGGDLNIQTRQLLVRDGGQVGTDTRSAGIGGDFNITALDSIELIGATADGRNYPSGLFAQSGIGATGDAGNLSIQTRQLLLKDGAQINTGTLGAGKGGNLTITAPDSIQVIGRSADGKFAGGLSTQADAGSTGDAGDLTIKTANLVVKDGAGITANTFGAGKGGNLNITADEGIQVIDTSADGRDSTSLYTSSEPEATGDAGDLNIATNSLRIKQASVSVRSRGQGNAGTLNVDANSIRLDNNGIITANTQSINKDPNKPQANINVDSQDLILRGNSNFNANAEGENVIGGNINIDSGVLGVLEQSRISANSTDSRGGRVTINTQSIFGTQPWYPEAFRGFITATGATPLLSGTVQINTPDVDPSSGLIELPVNLVDASNQINTACTPGGSQFENTFVSTGRGGLPMNPTEPLQENSTLSTWVKLKPQSPSGRNTIIKPRPRKASNNNKVTQIKQIVEATGWIVNKEGNIEFVADANQVNPRKNRQTPAACKVSG